MKKKVVLTGDRPTGPLHLGHYVGSLANRVYLQDVYKQYVLIADMQALTDNYEHPDKVRQNVLEVVLDYLAVGLDPKKTTFFIQSQIPQIAELAVIYLNLVTINRLRRNPTVKNEIAQKGYGENVTAGFLMYPVHQAADITIVKGSVIPVGADQLPMIEQTNEIVRSFNHIYHTDILVESEPLISSTPRLPGIDGGEKMGKSLGNAIFLSDSSDVIVKKVMSMYTDPNHVHVNDPGKVEGNVVFTYLDIFDQNKDEVQELKEQYQRGGLGDVKLKKRLIEVLESFLLPIRLRREEFAKDKAEVMKILFDGSAQTVQVASETMREVHAVMKLDYFD